MRELREREQWSDVRLAEMIRGRIVGRIHTGRLDVGDRLPSYREVAEETGADLRAVARVYRRLEAEGLVEVRGRSGVYVAPQERIGGRVLAETARWMVGVLREAWTRRIALPGLPEFVRGCTAAATVRCAFVESTADQLQAFGGELRDDFGFAVSAVHADRLSGGAPPPELAAAHLVATTAFHAGEARDAAARLGKPLVVIRLNRMFTREIQRRLAAEELDVLYADEAFVERVRLIAGSVYAGRVRGVSARDPEAVARLDPSRPVLVSPAARALLPGAELPPSFPPEPMIGAEAAEELAELLLRFNLEALAGRPPAG